MTELTALFQLASILNTPMLAAIGWLVWRIYNNHLPHMQKQIDELLGRVSNLEGVKAGVELERLRKR